MPFFLQASTHPTACFDALTYPALDVVFKPANGLWPEIDLLWELASANVFIDRAAR